MMMDTSRTHLDARRNHFVVVNGMHFRIPTALLVMQIERPLANHAVLCLNSVLLLESYRLLPVDERNRRALD